MHLSFYLFLLITFLSSRVGISYTDENSASINAGLGINALSGATTLVGLRDLITGIERTSAQKFKVDLPDGWKMFLRGLSMVAVELPLDDQAMLLQHEFFGHGSRCQEFGGTPTFIYKGAPLPYGLGLAASGCNERVLTDMQYHVINVGGVASNDVMAQYMASKWIAGKKIAGPSTWLYVLSASQTTGYLLIGQQLLGASGKIAGSGDMSKYVDSINGLYQSEKAISIPQLRNWSLLNFLDPLFFNSLYAMYHYVRYGEDAPVWMIPFSEQLSYLPMLKYTLAPHGPEWQLHNYLTIYDRVVDINLHGGDTAGHFYWGVGISGQAWRYRGLTLGGHIELWQQPELRMGADMSDDRKFIDSNSGFGPLKMGFLATANASYRLIDPVAIDLEIGGKNKGYVAGEMIDASLILRSGLTIYF